MRAVISAFFLFVVAQTSAFAAPGMTWAQEKAWLVQNPGVQSGSVHHGYDADLGVNTGLARVQALRRWWTVHVTLTHGDVVTEESFTPDKGGGAIRTQGGPVVAALFDSMYGGSAVASEYANASLVVSVPMNGSNASQQFFAAKNGKYGFMLDPYEIVVFRSSELQQRIKRAKYCSTHSECGE